MRRWIWFVVLLAAFLGYTVLTNIGSTQALVSIANRPILALVKDATRIPVQQPGQPRQDGEAGGLGGTGVTFGYRFTYVLPSGGNVVCTIRFSSLGCSDGWQAERAPG